MNLFMSRLDEQTQRWYAGLEAIAKITGLPVNTIRRGQNAMANDLSDRPGTCPHRRRGRPSVEKTTEMLLLPT